MTKPDIARDLWRAAVPGAYPDTAEERAAVDAKLKAGLLAISDVAVRHHALEILRDIRLEAIRAGRGGGMTVAVVKRLVLRGVRWFSSWRPL